MSKKQATSEQDDAITALKVAAERFNKLPDDLRAPLMKEPRCACDGLCLLCC